MAVTKCLNILILSGRVPKVNITNLSMKELRSLRSISSKFKAFDREINIDTFLYQKDILTNNENYHGTQHIKSFFLYLAVLISNS